MTSNTTTIEIDRETHLLIRQYCIINSITSKEFIKNLTKDSLKEFKQKIESIKN